MRAFDAPRMALIVQKFGGTSVGSIERMKNVAERVMRTKKAGHDASGVESNMQCANVCSCTIVHAPKAGGGCQVGENPASACG